MTSEAPNTAPTTCPVVTFIIPVRHPDNARDWPGLTSRLIETASSIAAQAHAGWRAIVVANHGADLPRLPKGFDVVRVDHGPNPVHDIGAANREAAYEAVRLNKGYRVLAGMLAAGRTGYFMIVDDDDFVSRDIVAHAAAHEGANGWAVHRGFVWTEGGRLVFLHPRFASFCGTSHIVRSDLYDLPPSVEAAGERYVKDMLGSHVRIDDILAARGTPLAPLPFAGAVYRVGHAGAHSKSRGVIRTALLNRTTLASPRLFWHNLKSMRFLSPQIAGHFGMKV
ncbi:MAG: galactosyl transferase [Burkholderiales bacterium]|nr:galactosyl transferase [Burkholderiales bacterium]